MKIIIDCNRLIASLIKDGTTREIFLDDYYEFLAPEHIVEELHANKDWIMKKVGLNANEFNLILYIFFEKIKIIPETKYFPYIKKFTDKIRDPKDIAYLAGSQCEDALGIWTHDKHFLDQNEIKIFTNIDLLKIRK